MILAKIGTFWQSFARIGPTVYEIAVSRKQKIFLIDCRHRVPYVLVKMARDGIVGHEFNKRLMSFAPCYSQSLLLAVFKENHTLLWF
jgi:hypothetical protein